MHNCICLAWKLGAGHPCLRQRQKLSYISFAMASLIYNTRGGATIFFVFFCHRAVLEVEDEWRI